ncbi:MAG: N-acetyl-gamma-glutamyl-phosphate reductase, partial [Anaerolineae bacterium]
KPEWLAEAVYGLTEHAREAVKEADIVACPGCYPTSVLIPLQPIITAGGVKADSHIIADSKTGVSGGGRKAKLLYNHVEVQDNMTPYAIGQSHRHWAEMNEKITGWSNGHGTPQLIFSPHLMAIPRGILSTIYVQLEDDWDEAKVRELYESAYNDEAFVKLLPAGKTATVAHAVRSNRVAIGMTVAGGNMLILTCAIDNLTKGSSGQAVQNFNLMYGFEETTALM